MKRLDGLLVVSPYDLDDSMTLKELTGNSGTMNSSGFTRLDSDESDWIDVDSSSVGFAWIGVRRNRMDSRRLESDELEWIHVVWSQMN